MSQSVECPRCHTPSSVVVAPDGAPVRCSNCQEVITGKADGEESPRTDRPAPPKRRSKALLWILLGIRFLLLLPAFGVIGVIAYGFYWLDLDESPKNPVIVGDPGPEIPRMIPGMGAGGGGDNRPNPPKAKIENVRAAAPRILLD